MAEKQQGISIIAKHILKMLSQIQIQLQVFSSKAASYLVLHTMEIQRNLHEQSTL